MKIVVLDGYTENPGDLSWEPLKQLGDLTVYDRTPVSERDEIIRYLEGVGCLFRTIIAYGREEGDIRDLHTMMAAGEKLVDMVLFGIFLQPPLTQTEQPGVKYPENKERA